MGAADPRLSPRLWRALEVLAEQSRPISGPRMYFLMGEPMPHHPGGSTTAMALVRRGLARWIPVESSSEYAITREGRAALRARGGEAVR